MLFTIVAAALAAAAPSFTPPTPDPSVGPPEALLTAEDYPPGALDRGEQGTVWVDLHIDAEGRISRCDIKTSSGFPELDAKTCTVLTERAKFLPARNARGRAVPSEYIRSVVWRIEDDATPSDPWTATAVTGLGGDGKPISCQTMVEGDPSLWKEHPPCMQDVPASVLPAGTRSLAVIVQFRPGLAPPAALHPGDSVIGRSVVALNIDATGTISSCETIEAVGKFESLDYCTSLRGREFRPRAGPDGKPAPFAATMATTIIAHVEPPAVSGAKP